MGNKRTGVVRIVVAALCFAGLTAVWKFGPALHDWLGFTREPFSAGELLALMCLIIALCVGLDSAASDGS